MFKIILKNVSLWVALVIIGVYTISSESYLIIIIYSFVIAYHFIVSAVMDITKFLEKK